MKVFDYRCNECDTVFEKFIKSEEDKIYCPTCNSVKLQKLVGATKFVMRQSDLMSKVPGGFKSILNHHAKRAGSLNKIETGGLGEV